MTKPKKFADGQSTKRKTSRRKPKFLAQPDNAPGLSEPFSTFAERMAAHGNMPALQAYQEAIAAGETHEDIQRDGLKIVVVEATPENKPEEKSIDEHLADEAALFFVPNHEESANNDSATPEATPESANPEPQEELKASASKSKPTYTLESIGYILQSGSVTQLLRVKPDNPTTKKVLKALEAGDITVFDEVKGVCKGRQRKELGIILHQFVQLYGQTFDTLDAALNFQPEETTSA